MNNKLIYSLKERENHMNNKMIEYKENIFTKILNFFKRIFKKDISPTENIIEKTIENEKKNNEFFENIYIKQNEEEMRLKKLQLQYDNGEIDEDDILEEDMDKLIEMYEKETDELNKDTENIKIHITKMLNKLKNS